MTRVAHLAATCSSPQFLPCLTVFIAWTRQVHQRGARQIALGRRLTTDLIMTSYRYRLTRPTSTLHGFGHCLLTSTMNLLCHFNVGLEDSINQENTAILQVCYSLTCDVMVK